MDTDAESGDDVRGVSSRAAAGVRVAHGSCQRGSGVAKTRGAERFGSTAPACGGERRHGGKQRREME